jgi:sterol desaturase/sphingolipid hydroxylase (fatty acid hydroxylase superfamily)
MEQLAFTIIAVILIAAVFFSWFFYQKARSKERLILLEKGQDLKNEFRFRLPLLKIGIFVVGISIGLGIITFVTMDPKNERLLQTGFPFFILGLCGGISLIIANFVDRRNKME